MRAKKKLPKYRRVFRRILSCTLALIIVTVIFFEATVRDRLELSIIAQIKSVSSGAINTAVSEYLKVNSDICRQMVDIHCDDGNNVKSISENIPLIYSLD